MKFLKFLPGIYWIRTPYNANAWYNLGVVYNRLGKFESSHLKLMTTPF